MQNNVVLVTGGTGAIGTAICRRFFADGYTVVANCHPADAVRSEQALHKLEQQGTSITLAQFDVTDPDACEQAISDIESTQGAIDVLVNAAGITRDAKLTKMTPEAWNAVLSTNLDGVFNVTRQCVPPMSERKYGRIINISSVNGQRGQYGQTNYSAAKAGMTGFTKALARETARDRITVNSVSPGYVQSPMIEAVPENVREMILKEIPLGRFAEPDEIARAVGFLAHPDSGYITGTDLSVNGGFHMG